MGLTALEHVRTEQSAFTPAEGEFDTDIVPFGIYHVDAVLPMGVKVTSPKLCVIQGGSGSRKTTLMLNIIVNMCLSGNLPPGHKIVFDSLENGFTLERSMVVLRSILATRYIIYRHYTGFRDISAEEPATDYLRQLFAYDIESGDPQFLVRNITFSFNGRDVAECAFTSDFVEAWYANKLHLTPLQNKAWMIAGDALATFPIEFFGVSEHPNYDIADKRSTPTIYIEQSYERWCKLAEECLSIQIITDYLQEYWLPNTSDHYQKQLVVTPWLSRFIKEKRKTIWCISQEGIGHQRDFASKGVVMGSSGGDMLKAASQLNWRVSYAKETNPFFMTLHSPVKLTRGNHPDLALMIEPNSGAIFGRSRIMER